MLESDKKTFGVLKLTGHPASSPGNYVPPEVQAQAEELPLDELFLFTQTDLQRAILKRFPWLLGIDAAHNIFVRTLGRIKLIFIMATTYSIEDPLNADLEQGLSVATILCTSESAKVVKFIAVCLNASMQRVGGFVPKALMSDMASTFHIGFEQVFGFLWWIWCACKSSWMFVGTRVILLTYNKN
jgi:hypothetical protein